MLSTKFRKAVAALAVSAGAIGFIASQEGFVDHTYKDVVGVKTIGYGHTGKDVKDGQTITRQQAEALLVKDANAHWNQAKKYIKVPLYQHEADAYASFVFNIGIGNFKRSTLLKKLNRKDYCGACKELKKWVYAGGKKLKGLERRRESEYQMCIGNVK